MKKWKWNWGTGLALALGAFIITMGFTLYRASQHRWDLVTQDYYEKELAYQDVIDGKENAKLLSEQPRIFYAHDQLHISLPKQLQGNVANGHIEWYCLQDATRDFTETLDQWKIRDKSWPVAKFSSGKWMAKITLDIEGTAYYFEPQITLP